MGKNIILTGMMGCGKTTVGRLLARRLGRPLADTDLLNEAISTLKENGLVFWLDRDPGETYDGLDLSGRPLAQGGREDFLRRYRDRAPVYRRWADHTVRANSPQIAAARIDAICSEV